MKIDEYFDKIYLLNLKKRPERLKLAEKRMNFCDIEFDTFNATDGSVMNRVWKSYSKENKFFSNSSYLGCAISHLSIYRDAVERGYEKILIVEDDNRINRNANEIFSSNIDNVPIDWKLLYLGFIPLSDDCSMWTYNNFTFHSTNVAIANNFWGLFAYGITNSLMKDTLELYDRDFPMELDRHFVKDVQPNGFSYGIVPQIFAADDGVSDNSNIMETNMLERSIDARFAQIKNYV